MFLSRREEEVFKLGLVYFPCGYFGLLLLLMRMVIFEKSFILLFSLLLFLLFCFCYFWFLSASTDLSRLLFISKLELLLLIFSWLAWSQPLILLLERFFPTFSFSWQKNPWPNDRWLFPSSIFSFKTAISSVITFFLPSYFSGLHLSEFLYEFWLDCWEYILFSLTLSLSLLRVWVLFFSSLTSCRHLRNLIWRSPNFLSFLN